MKIQEVKNHTTTTYCGIWVGDLMLLASAESQSVLPFLSIHAIHLLGIIAPKDASTHPAGGQCLNTCQTSCPIKASKLAKPHVLPCCSHELGWQQEHCCPSSQSGKKIQLPFVTQDHDSGWHLDLGLFWESYYPGDVIFYSGNDTIVNKKLGILLMEDISKQLKEKNKWGWKTSHSYVYSNHNCKGTIKKPQSSN